MKVDMSPLKRVAPQIVFYKILRPLKRVGEMKPKAKMVTIQK